MKFDQNLCKNFDMTKEVILVSRTQPSGPLCLWQCFIRDVIAEKMFQSCQRYMLGGLSLAVDIDESMFGKYTS